MAKVVQFVVPVTDPNRNSFRVKLYKAGDHNTLVSQADETPNVDSGSGEGFIDITALIQALVPGSAVDVAIVTVGPAGESTESFADNNPITVPYQQPIAPSVVHNVV